MRKSSDAKLRDALDSRKYAAVVCTLGEIVVLVTTYLSSTARYHFDFGVSGEAYQIQAGIIWWTSWTANVSIMQNEFLLDA